MAIVRIFDGYYNNFWREQSLAWWTGGGQQLQSRSDTYSIYTYDAAKGNPVYYFSNLSELYAQFAVTITTTNFLFYSENVATIEYNGTAFLTIINHYGKIRISGPDGNTTIVGKNFKYFKFKLFEIHAQIAGAGVFEIKLDGESIYTYNGDTRVGGNTAINSLHIYQSRGNAFDDIIIHDTTGAFNNSWVNGGRITNILPTAQGDSNSFQPSASNNYTYVDERDVENDSNFVYTQALGVKDLYNMATIGIPCLERINGLCYLNAGGLSSDNTLQLQGTPTVDTVNFKEGDASWNWNGNTYGYITDANMTSDFPLKSTGTKAFTMCFWLRNNIDVNYGAAVSKWYYGGNKRSWAFIPRNGSNNGYMVWGYTNGVLYETWDFTWKPTNGQWYHYGIAVNGILKTAYLRVWGDTEAGIVYEESHTFTNDLWLGNCSFVLGAEDYGNNNIKANMDQFLMFKTVLPSGDIDSIRAGTYDLNADDNVVAQYSFDSTFGQYNMHKASTFVITPKVKVSGVESAIGSPYTADFDLRVPHKFYWDYNPNTSTWFVQADIDDIQAGYEV